MPPSDRSDENKTFNAVLSLGSVATLAGAGLAAFAAHRYHVATPSQFIVRTGMGIKGNMSVSKRAMQWPFQQARRVDMSPVTLTFRLHNMSKGKVEFELPVVFTVAPANPDENMGSFKRYCTMVTGMGHDEVVQTIQGVVEGETRGLTSTMTVEEIFNAKDKFREEVVERIAADLDKLGVRILNANIKEMRDYDEKNMYFEYRKRRAIETANYEAQVEVSRAQRDGEIGVKDNEAEARKRKAELDMAATVKENEARQRIVQSEADLERKRQEARLAVERAAVETDNEVQRRNHELQKEVEKARQEAMLAQQRATDFSRAQVESETVRERAAGRADAMRIEAEAALYAKQQEAEGIRATLEAQAEGLQSMLSAADPDLVRFYLARDKLVPLAQTQADAFRDLKPNITVWGGGDGNHKNSVAGVVTDIFQSLAPLGEMVAQKGVKVPFYEGASDKVPGGGDCPDSFPLR